MNLFMNNGAMQPQNTNYLRPIPPHLFKHLSGEIVRQLTEGGMAPEIAVTAYMATISLLGQGVADLMWPNGLKCPVGVSGMLVAPTSFGKSVLKKTLITLIEDAVASLCEIDEKYGAFFIEDATREALAHNLSILPVCSLVTDEAGQIIQLFRNSATLAKFLDGSTTRYSRVSTGRKAIFDPRFIMLLMTQPDKFALLKPMISGKGDVCVINRMIVTPVLSAQTSSLHNVFLSEPTRLAYRGKVDTLLKATMRHVEKGSEGRPTLRLSSEAAQNLISLGEQVRQACLPGSSLFHIAEYAARHAERVFRMAGALHIFENGAEGEIDAEIFHQAAILGQWYLESYAYMMHEPPKVSQAEIDAISMEPALYKHYYVCGVEMKLQSEMRALSLNMGLTPQRFNKALAILCEQGKVYVVMHKNKPWIAINRFQRIQ